VKRSASMLRTSADAGLLPENLLERFGGADVAVPALADRIQDLAAIGVGRRIDLEGELLGAEKPVFEIGHSPGEGAFAVFCFREVHRTKW